MTARPVTQQGLAGAKMNMHVGRQIQDAQYFYAKLSEKLSQVTEVNESLQQELLNIEKNSSKQLQMQSRFDELKDEVKTLEVSLRDHNLVLQRGAVQASAADVEDQIRVTNVSCGDLVRSSGSDPMVFSTRRHNTITLPFLPHTGYVGNVVVTPHRQLLLAFLSIAIPSPGRQHVCPRTLQPRFQPWTQCVAPCAKRLMLPQATM